MGNKSNLITLRPNFNAAVDRLNLDQALYAMSFLQLFDTLFLKKNVFLTDSKLLVVENKIFLTLFIFFRVAKLLKLSKKKQKKFKKYKKRMNTRYNKKSRKVTTRKLVSISWLRLHRQKYNDKINKFTTRFLFNKSLLKKFKRKKSAFFMFNKSLRNNNSTNRFKNNKFNKFNKVTKTNNSGQNPLRKTKSTLSSTESTPAIIKNKPAFSKTKIRRGLSRTANKTKTKIKTEASPKAITPSSSNTQNKVVTETPDTYAASLSITKDLGHKTANKVCIKLLISQRRNKLNTAGANDHFNLDKKNKAFILNKINKNSLSTAAVTLNKSSNKIINKPSKLVLITKLNKVAILKKRKKAVRLKKSKKAIVLNKLKKNIAFIKLKKFSKVGTLNNNSKKVLVSNKSNKRTIATKSSKTLVVNKSNKSPILSKLNKSAVKTTTEPKLVTKPSKRGKKNQKKIKIKKKFASMFKAFSFFKVNLIVYTVVNLNFCLKKHKNLISLFYNTLKKDGLRLFPRRFRFFLDFVQISVLLLKQKIKAKFLLKNLVDIFRMLQKKLHSKFLNFISQYFKLLILESSFLAVNLKGLKLVISGKLKGKPRSTKYIYSVGSVPIQTLSCNIDYAKGHAFTIYGVFGFKLWIST